LHLTDKDALILANDVKHSAVCILTYENLILDHVDLFQQSLLLLFKRRHLNSLGIIHKLWKIKQNYCSLILTGRPNFYSACTRHQPFNRWPTRTKWKSGHSSED